MADYIIELRETSPLKSVRKKHTNYMVRELTLVATNSLIRPFVARRPGEDRSFLKAGIAYVPTRTFCVGLKQILKKYFILGA